jgi:hypothetical protein
VSMGAASGDRGQRAQGDEKQAYRQRSAHDRPPLKAA